MKSLSHTRIYEQKSVYGDKSKFGKNTNRLKKMLMLITSIDNAPKKILDVGCGTGFLTNEMKNMYPEAYVCGIDISQKALTQARREYKNVRFIYTDVAKELPFPDNHFDLVVSGEHIEHLVDTDIYLSEINRVTKTGGQLILTTPNLASWFNRILLLFGKQPFKTEASYRLTLPIFSIFGLTFPENLSTPAVGHLRVLTLDMLIKLLKVYGFQTEKKLGRTMLTKPLLRQLDSLLSWYPSLASGLVIRSRKIS